MICQSDRATFKSSLTTAAEMDKKETDGTQASQDDH